MKKPKTELRFITSQIERPWKREFDFNPETPEQFHTTIQQATIEQLEGLGFMKWQLLSEAIGENRSRPAMQLVNIPVFDLDGIAAVLDGEEAQPVGDHTLDIGRGDAPTEMPAMDGIIMLFPGEWYASIPDGFEVITISGTREKFQPGVTDNDTRYGCLPYGILRPVE
jgi:hypothetical protein